MHAALFKAVSLVQVIELGATPRLQLDGRQNQGCHYCSNYCRPGSNYVTVITVITVVLLFSFITVLTLSQTAVIAQLAVR
jgi:hypothetical protein